MQNTTTAPPQGGTLPDLKPAPLDLTLPHFIAGTQPPERLPNPQDAMRGNPDAVGLRPIRKILVPTDFSTASEKAIERAVDLANYCGATLTILHVVDINTQPAPGEFGTGREVMKRRWHEGSARMIQLAQSLSAKVEAQTAVQEGLPWEEIVDKSRGFDLVLLGKPRAHKGWKLFSQHTAQRVIENAACPVMLVHDGE